MKSPEERIKNVTNQLNQFTDSEKVEALLLELRTSYAWYEDKARKFDNLCKNETVLNGTIAVSGSLIDEKIKQLRIEQKFYKMFSEQWSKRDFSITQLESLKK